MTLFGWFRKKGPSLSASISGKGYEVVDESTSVRCVRFHDTGDTWQFRRFMPVGVARLWMPKVMAALDFDNKGEITVKAQTESGATVFEEVSDIIVLNNTLSWSYGAIDKTTLEAAVPLHHYSIISKMMEEMYRPFLEESLNLLQSSFSYPSNEREPSRQN